jgi:hypothetical protein
MATGIGQYGFGATLARYAEAGVFFTAITPTPGTGIIGHAAPTTFDETKPLITLYNSSSDKRIFPVFLRMNVTVVSVGGARVQFTVCTDDGNRRSSAGTAMTVNNCNSGSSTASAATAHIGAVVATAATAQRRILSNILFRGTIDVVEDVYEIAFGGVGAGASVGSRPATVMDSTRMAPPVCLEPGDSLLIYQWAGSQSTGPTVEATFGFVEVAV